MELQLKELLRTQSSKTDQGFMCLICGKQLRWNMRRHMKDLHLANIAKYRCPVCQRVCNNKSIFYTHVNRSHVVKGLDYEKCRISENLVTYDYENKLF